MTLTKSNFCASVLQQLKACERQTEFNQSVVLLLECMRFFVDKFYTISHLMSQSERRTLIQAVRRCLDVNVPLIGTSGSVPRYLVRPVYHELRLYQMLLLGEFVSLGNPLQFVSLGDPDVVRFLGLSVTPD
jgi:hypothetical protein